MPLSDVNKPCAAYLEMARHWDPIDDLMGGTLRMQEVALQSEKWLPRFMHEEKDQYRKRVEISVLYNALADTVGQLVAKPFSEPMTLGGEELPLELQAIEANADRAGRSLHAVARASFEDAVKYGLSHFQVDMPVRVEGEAPATLDDTRSGRVRPAIIPRSAKDVIGWRHEQLPSGELRLVQARIRELVEAEDGEWGTKVVRQVLVLNAPNADGLGTWQRYREAGKNERDWTQIGSGSHSFPGVPLVTWYTREAGFMRALPPLADLAWLNVRHWQSSSDQARILSFARASAMVLLSGLQPNEMKDTTIAFMRIIRSTSEVAKATMIEHSGAAVAAGESDIKQLEERMETLGQQPFLERSSDSTATGVRSQANKTRTLLGSWIANEENALNAALAIAALFQGVSIPDDTKVDIHSDFTDFGGAASEHDSLLRARQAKQITQKTYLRESKRRRFYSEHLDVQEEIEETAAEGEAMGLVSGASFQPPPGSGDDVRGGAPSANGPAGPSKQAA